MIKGMRTSSSQQQRSYPIHSILQKTALQTDKATKGISMTVMRSDHEVDNSYCNIKEDSVETATTPRKGLMDNYKHFDFPHSSLDHAYVQSEISRQRKINDGIR